jgi:hypothetical protein
MGIPPNNNMVQVWGGQLDAHSSQQKYGFKYGEDMKDQGNLMRIPPNKSVGSNMGRTCRIKEITFLTALH